MIIKIQKKIKSLKIVLLFLFAGAAFFASNPTIANTNSSKMLSNPIKQEILNDHAAPNPVEISDPLQCFNRTMFAFNEKFDMYFYKPIATLYNYILPKPINRGIHNFFSNLGELPTIANDILQVNIHQALNDFWRLVFNSTVGIGGLFDVATCLNLPYYQNDFGLTLTNWGWRRSSYLVLPFLGSYTIRDGLVGMPVDYFGFSVYPRIKSMRTRFALLSVAFVDYRAQLLQFQPVIDEAALDKYIFVRSAYMQHRAAKIEENAQLKHHRCVPVNPNDLSYQPMQPSETSRHHF